MPATKNRIHYSALVQELSALADRQFVIDAVDPAVAIIEVGEPFFRRNVVAVLRPGRIATDFRLVIDGLAVSVCAQEIKTMVGSLFRLELKRVVSWNFLGFGLR